MSFNYLDSFLNDKWPSIRDHHLYVGVPRGNDFLNMVALVQEFGAHIQAKNYPYLWIPTENAAGRKAREIPGLYVRGHAAGYDDQDSSYGFCVCFVLKQAVDIPARAFIRNCVNANEKVWDSLAAIKLEQVMANRVTVDDFWQILGDRMVHDLQDTIQQFSNPNNAPLTVERKGKDDPLEDTDTLRQSIQWILI